MDDKKEILSRIDFVEEYKRYGIRFDTTIPSDSGWVPVHAFDRDDVSASAAINVKNGFYVDLGGSGRKLDFFDMLQALGKFGSFLEIVKFYAERFGMTLATSTSRSPRESVDILPWNGNARYWCYLKNATQESVWRAGGLYCRYMGQYMCIAFPVYSTPRILDTEASGYVVAQTSGVPLPKFDKNKKPIGSAKYKVVAGTTSGLIGAEALTTIQRARETGDVSDLTVFKVEGISDMTALLSKLPKDTQGKYLVLTNSCGAGEKPKPAWADAFAGLHVIVVHDADKPGQAGAREWCRYLSGLAKSVKNVILPYAVAPDHGKDLKDYLQEQGIQSFLDLVAATDITTEDHAPVQEMEPDNPHRIAQAYLDERHTIDGQDGLYSLVYQQGCYYQWRDGRYEYVSMDTMQAQMTQFCFEMFRADYQAAYAAWEASGTSKKPPVIRKVSGKIVGDILNVLRSLVFTTETAETYWRTCDVPSDYANDRDLIPLKNGVLHVGKMSQGEDDAFLPITPLWFHRHVLPIEYDEYAYSEAWHTLIQQNLVDTDTDLTKMLLLQEFFGYCMTSDTSLQKFLLLVGEGSNGKSAILTGFLAMLGGQNVSNIPLEMFSDRFALAFLRGKLANVVDDMQETDKICEGKLKSVVSGMSINSDRKNRDAIDFMPYAKLVFACNTPPRFQDKSSGIWRRLEMVFFNRTVDESHRKPEYCDVRFWEREAAGIFNWCLSGLLRLRRQGMQLTKCPESDAGKKEYVRDVNPAKSFVDEFLEPDTSNDYMSCRRLYKSYSDWCYANGTKPMNASNFGREVKRQFPKVEKSQRWVDTSRREYVYFGVRYQQGKSVGESDD